MDKKEKRIWKLIPLEVLLIAALFLMSLFVFAYIVHEAVYEQEDVFDARVHHFLLAHSTPLIIEVARCLTFLGSSLFLFPAYTALIAALLIRKQKRYAVHILVVASSAFVLLHLLKQVFHRHRPELPVIEGITTYSFPSGHALSSFIFCSILAYLTWKGNIRTVWKWLLTLLLLLLAVSIGISRIVLNVHYATDVIAGFCMGVIWVILSFWIIQKINKSKTV